MEPVEETKENNRTPLKEHGPEPEPIQPTIDYPEKKAKDPSPSQSSPLSGKSRNWSEKKLELASEPALGEGGISIVKELVQINNKLRTDLDGAHKENHQNKYEIYRVHGMQHIL